ncbi:MAG TPA: alpha/beta fold hydrolase [Candidatus Limnocylindrales bacterium]|nr:alpha/beta fold hydrolase [Candidatus Limnocylindrales bacterium]
MVEGHRLVNGVELYYEQTGAGPDVVLLHGGMVDLRMWHPQVEALQGSYRVLRLDFRGFGRSGWRAERYADHGDLHGLLEALGIESTHVVGLSMGGGVAIHFALEHPATVRSLVLAPGWLPGHVWSESLQRGFEPIAEAAGRGDLPRAVELLMRFAPMVPAAQQPGVREPLEQMLREYSWVHYLDQWEEERPAGPAAIERLGEIHAPCLVVAGADDVPEFLEQAEIMAREIPGAELRLIDGAGHVVNLERPREFNEALLDFLGRHAHA